MMILMSRQDHPPTAKPNPRILQKATGMPLATADRHECCCWCSSSSSYCYCCCSCCYCCYQQRGPQHYGDCRRPKHSFPGALHAPGVVGQDLDHRSQEAQGRLHPGTFVADIALPNSYWRILDLLLLRQVSCLVYCIVYDRGWCDVVLQEPKEADKVLQEAAVGAEDAALR